MHSLNQRLLRNKMNTKKKPLVSLKTLRQKTNGQNAIYISIIIWIILTIVFKNKTLRQTSSGEDIYFLMKIKDSGFIHFIWTFFILGQSFGGKHCPEGLRQACVLPTPPPLPKQQFARWCDQPNPFPLNELKNNNFKTMEEVVSPPAVAVELSISGRCRSLWMRTFTFHWLCVDFYRSRGGGCWFMVSVWPYFCNPNCCKTPHLFLKMDALKPLPFVTETTKRERWLDVLLKGVNVFV